MKPKYPIYIASKGRAEECLTAKRLALEDINIVLVVEPQDEKAYRKIYGGEVGVFIMVLPENDKGISYARNYILETARINGTKFYWMLDDDIKEMYCVENKKCIKAPFYKVLKQAEQTLEKVEGLAVGSLEYQQYAWAAGKPLAMNSYCDVAVLISVENTLNIKYRDNCKEDRDFVLQALAMGYQSARSSWTAMSVPKNGSNKGGLHEAYKAGLENHWSKRMVEMWPGVCEHHTKKDGRPDVKIKWRVLKPR